MLARVCVCLRVVSEPGEGMADVWTLGAGGDKLPGWWHPSEVKGLGFDIWLLEGIAIGDHK